MKLSYLLWGLLVGAVADEVTQRAAEEDEYDEYGIPADYSDKTTEFDGKKVPPILELTPDNFDTEIKASKYMLVKLYRCVDTLGQISWSCRNANKQQSVLPSLPGLCARLPHLVRILLHRAVAQPVYIIHGVL